MQFWEWIKQPWPWYVAGPLIGLTVPLLLIMGNKTFGVSSSLRHICAACIPANIPFFKYNWRKESWNLFFVAGILLGALIGTQWLNSGEPIVVDQRLVNDLEQYHIRNYSSIVPVKQVNRYNG